MKEDLSKYDTSDYEIDNPFGMPRVNKKVPGLFKDELNGKIMDGFIGLRSKMYCVQSTGIDKMKKAKGVKKYMMKKIDFEDYHVRLLSNDSIVQFQNSFRSKFHKMYTIRQKKVTLSPFDSKRHILPNNVDTMAWGHHKIGNF